MSELKCFSRMHIILGDNYDEDEFFNVDRIKHVPRVGDVITYNSTRDEKGYFPDTFHLDTSKPKFKCMGIVTKVEHVFDERGYKDNESILQFVIVYLKPIKKD